MISFRKFLESFDFIDPRSEEDGENKTVLSPSDIGTSKYRVKTSKLPKGMNLISRNRLFGDSKWSIKSHYENNLNLNKRIIELFVNADEYPGELFIVFSKIKDESTKLYYEEEIKNYKDFFINNIKRYLKNKINNFLLKNQNQKVLKIDSVSYSEFISTNEYEDIMIFAKKVMNESKDFYIIHEERKQQWNVVLSFMLLNRNAHDGNEVDWRPTETTPEDYYAL